jgi:hypothetical protein
VGGWPEKSAALRATDVPVMQDKGTSLSGTNGKIRPGAVPCLVAAWKLGEAGSVRHRPVADVAGVQVVVDSARILPRAP